MRHVTEPNWNAKPPDIVHILAYNEYALWYCNLSWWKRIYEHIRLLL